MMKIPLFSLLILVSCPGIRGQQTISSMGMICNNERISCEMSLGEIDFGAEEMPENSSIQIISGILSPSEGIITPTGNEISPTIDAPFRLYKSGNQLCISNTNGRAIDCQVYSIKGELLYRETIQSSIFTLPVLSRNSKILLIHLRQKDFSQTFKVVMP